MKRTLLFYILPFLFCQVWHNSILAQMPPARCGTSQYESQQLAHNPDLRSSKLDIENWTKYWIQLHTIGFSNRNNIEIPLVVHVVWFGEDENISDLQIQSQIDALNEDFNGRNINQDQIPSIFRAVTGSAGIEFCLANTDPYGNPTNGIVRKQTSFINIGDQGESWDEKRIYYDALGGSDAWDPEHYLNIWVARMNDYVGYASNPGEVIPAEDGVVIDPRYFGRIGQVKAPFNLGRTTTHEIGHYFNLKHLWGDEIDDCTTDDFVDDTPFQSRPYYGCPEHPQISCGSYDQFMNFMDYVADPCMSMFTVGQKNRIMATLYGPRSGLMQSNGCSSPVDNTKKDFGEITLFPNPASDYIALKRKPNTTYPVDITMFNGIGLVVLEKKAQNEYIPFLNIESLPQGMYFVNITANGNEEVHKIIVY
jgi:hypothetical protein